MKAPFIHFYSTIFNKQKALSDTAEFPRKPIYKGQLKTGGQGKQTLNNRGLSFPSSTHWHTGKQYTALSSGGTTREEKNSCSNRLSSAWQGPCNTGRPSTSLSCHWRAATFLWNKPGWQASQCVCSYWNTEARRLKVKLCLGWFFDVWLNGNTLRGQDPHRFFSSSRCLLSTLPTAFSITQLFLAGKRPLGSLLERLAFLL